MATKRRPPQDPAPTGTTVQNVEALFDELIPDAGYAYERSWENDEDYLRATAAVTHRENQLAEDATLKSLRMKLDAAKLTARRRVLERKARCEKVRREYRAKGLTPEIQKKLAKLVDEVNKN